MLKINWRLSLGVKKKDKYKDICMTTSIINIVLTKLDKLLQSSLLKQDPFW